MKKILGSITNSDNDTVKQIHDNCWNELNKKCHPVLEEIQKEIDSNKAFRHAHDEKDANDTLDLLNRTFDVVYLLISALDRECMRAYINKSENIETWEKYAPITCKYLNI